MINLDVVSTSPASPRETGSDSSRELDGASSPRLESTDRTRPWSIAAAGVIVTLGGLALIVVACVMLIHGKTTDAGQQSIAPAVATAVTFALTGLVVLLGGVGLLLGKTWGRAIAVVISVCCLPAAYTMLTNRQPAWGSLIGVAAIAAIVFVFLPTSTAYINSGDDS